MIAGRAIQTSIKRRFLALSIASHKRFTAVSCRFYFASDEKISFHIG